MSVSCFLRGLCLVFFLAPLSLHAQEVPAVPALPCSLPVVEAVTTTEVIPPTNEPLATVEPAVDPIVESCEFLMVELLADPSAGPEWVRLESVTGTPSLACLLGYSLSNGSKTAFAFTTSSIESLTYTTSTVTSVPVFFPMPARSLTNGGATLMFLNASGTVLDQTTFPALKKDERWVRTSIEVNAWERSSVLEAVAPVVSTEVSEPVVAETASSSAMTSGSDSISDELMPGTEPAYASEELTAGAEADIAPEEDLLMKDLAVPATESPPPAVKAAAVKKKTTTVKKAAVAKPKAVKVIPPIPTYTFDMFSSVSESMRVRLIGTVGSPSGLLAQQTFVLQNMDGRGLLVKMNREQPMPAMGQTIELTGLLRFTNDQLNLVMQAQDRWKPVTPFGTAVPRPVDLLAPGQEDAWSLMAVTATVREVKATSILVEMDEVAISVKIRPVTGYRAARLKPGDVIQIKGLLDIRTDPVLYPRSAEDITVLQSAQAVVAATKMPEAPPWMPLGAAGAVVAFGQGLQEWRRRRETKRLERRLARSMGTFEGISPPVLARREMS